MTKLSWNSNGENVYEHGVDRVVAYPEVGNGVAWSGVTQISERNDSKVDGYYLDGLKYVQVPSYGEYGASLETYAIPQELNLCLGFAQLSPGLFATNQRRRSFGLAYRTFIGDEESDRRTYKLHLVYNAVANPSFGESVTMQNVPEPVSHGLELTTMPPADSAANMRPTAHLVIDGRYMPPDVMEDIERVLYGTNLLEPRLLTPNELLAMIDMPAYSTFWDGAANASTSRMVRRTGELVATNLATNPSFETTSGTVEVRRNLIPNPTFRTGVDTWSPRGGTLHSQDWPQMWSGQRGSGSVRTGQLNSTGIGAYLGIEQPMTTSPVVGGQWIAVSALIACDLQDNIGCRMDVLCNTPTGYTFHLSGEWQPAPFYAGRRITWAFQAPEDATTFGVRAQMYSGANETMIPAGRRLWLGDVHSATAATEAQALAQVQKYFDGSTSPDPDLTPSWADTANASASVLTGARLAADNLIFRTTVISSTRWASTGTKSLRIIPTDGTTSNTWVAFNVRLWPGFEPGKTYTMLGTMHLDAPQTGNIHFNARRMRYLFNVGSGNIEGSSEQAPNVAGDHELRMTFTVPTGTLASGYVYLYNGASEGNGDVWWDNFAIIEGEYTGPWFDGSNVPTHTY